MQRFRSSSFINGVQDLIFNHGFRQLSLYSTSTSISISTEVNPNFVNYLVDNLGFSKQQALSTSSKFNLQRQFYRQPFKELNDYHLIEKADSVITYFKEIGLQQSHIQKAVIVHPIILLYDVEKSLNPNFNIFLKLGFFNPDVAEVISANSKFIKSYKRLNQDAKKFSKFDSANSNVDKTLTPNDDASLKLGSSESDIAAVVSGNPSLEGLDATIASPIPKSVGKTLTPNNDALLKLGFTESDIDALVSANPSLDLEGLSATIALAIQALRDIMGCEGCQVERFQVEGCQVERFQVQGCQVERCQVEGCQVIPILNKLSRRKHSLYDIPDCMIRNVAFLRYCGVPLDEIRDHLHRKPYVFVSDTGTFRNTLARVEKILGVPPNTPRFLVGVEVFPYFNDEVIKSRMQIYRSYGWTDSDIVIHLLSSHEILRMSNFNIKKKLDFLMHELGYDPTYLAPKCNLFTSSIEKKLVPRLKALEVLKENGLISEDYDLWAVIKYTNSEFLNEFVLPYKEVHEVYSEHAGICLEMLRSSKPSSNAV